MKRRHSCLFLLSSGILMANLAACSSSDDTTAPFNDSDAATDSSSLTDTQTPQDSGAGNHDASDAGSDTGTSTDSAVNPDTQSPQDSSIVDSSTLDSTAVDSSKPETGTDSAAPTDGWLRIEGNKILESNGTRFHGRGVNIFDTRDGGACGWAAPIVDEWIRRIDVLIDQWHVNFFRLDLTSWASNSVGGVTVVQWKDVTQDASYLADLKKIVDHIGTKTGVRVMITLFSHPSQDTHELPTTATLPVYKKLAETFLNSPQVLYGVTNEPHDTSDAAVWTAMNTAVETFRSVEPAAGPHHIVVVQGTQGYGRELAYYVTHPITAGGGANVAYETHVYNPVSDWKSQFIDPAKTLPVIIGEYGPDGTYMKTVAEAKALMVQAETLEIPYMGWSFSGQNGPTMITASDYDECSTTNMAIVPTEWGQAVKDRLAKAW